MNTPTRAHAVSPAADASKDPRWALVVARDAGAEGRFVYAVRTTGIYCRPGSASRLPNPANVQFFDTPQAAEAAGYRRSRREAFEARAVAARHAERVAQACRRIESAESAPTLKELAEQAGMSPHHFHRVFARITGITPKAYAASRRACRIRERLARGDARITDAIYESGFGSASRFYEASPRLLGMHAKNFRAGGLDTAIRFAVGECSMGSILVAESERGICAIALGDDPDALVRELQDRFHSAELIGGDAAFEQRVAQVIGFVEAPRLGLDLPLDVRGTAFQERVWRALQQVPAGETVTYSQIAARIGMPKSVRAVAHACASNRLAVAIPCHRVVRRDGTLSGYRWGVERKRELLERERAARSGEQRDPCETGSA